MTQRMLQGGDSMKATTVSYRTLMAGIPAAARANAAPGPHSATTDPVFAAIARHREAVQALTTAHEPPDELVTQLLRAEVDAFLAWLATPPTTLAGALATLEYASHRPSVWDYPDDHVYTGPAKAAQYDDILEACEQFPAVIAATLRQMVAEKLL
jgi:hypothetical protein